MSEIDDLKFKLLRSEDKKELYGMTAIWLIGLVILLAINLYFCMAAKAGGFGEIGTSRFNTPEDSLWWQGPYPHGFQLATGFYRIGYEKGPFRVSWFDLGNYSTHALATSDEVKLYAGKCNVSTCASPDYYETRGSVRGILFSGLYRKGQMFFEGGASITKQKFSYLRLVFRNDFDGADRDRYQSFAGQHTAVGYMASVGFEHRGFTFSLAYWLNGRSSEFRGDGNDTPGIDTVKTFAIGYRF